MGTAKFFCEEPNSNYFRLCGEFVVPVQSVIQPSLLQHRAARDTVYGCVPGKLRIQKQMAWILCDCSLPTSVLDENNKWN